MGRQPNFSYRFSVFQGFSARPHLVQGLHDLMAQLLELSGRCHQVRDLVDRAAGAHRRPHPVR